ncbi:hypothetical protein ACFQ3P_29400 [Paraburkholderia sabiae]|uniref:Uncharacterized protein n=1 Tax=Paraburkholderia sabiae TaxID=273251 RepID=A0ABU9QH46_9BURK|nr:MULTISPECIES: hypothetical protein [Burkholderiaceae]MDR5877813.1 hypothetical protein [Caballeronia sp. LZ032]WJZ75521.1 hypothetical protein QEN71_06895 [Paraburkholderia sabiae]CAD6557177.1 hypothetical protein LMG24235_06054 [Paraburkholderia sabiae]
MVTTVTFDANALARINEHAGVVSALGDGRIKGYFSQTYRSLEGIQKNDRAEALAKTNVVRRSTSPDNQTANITIEVRHYRPPLDEKYQAAVEEALSLGLRALRGPARWVDGLTVKDPDQSFYVVETIQEMVAHRENVNKVAAAIEMRGVGRAIALELGNQYNASVGVTPANPKLWLEGLGHAKTKAQRKTVAKAIAEWSDGDGIASHVGYGIDLYCSDDFGHNAGGPTIMNLENRAWLSSVYGVVFVTLSELAEKLNVG